MQVPRIRRQEVAFVTSNIYIPRSLGSNLTSSSAANTRSFGDSNIPSTDTQPCVSLDTTYQGHLYTSTYDLCDRVWSCKPPAPSEPKQPVPLFDQDGGRNEGRFCRLFAISLPWLASLSHMASTRGAEDFPGQIRDAWLPAANLLCQYVI